MSNNISMATQFEFTELEINGVNALQVFVSIELFENIFIGGVTGSVSIFDTDSLAFIEKNDIEFIEEIKFSFKNGEGVELTFEGFMNGLRDEVSGAQKKIYTIDFTSKSVRENEMNFINKAFTDQKPEDIVREMVKKLSPDNETIDYGSSSSSNGEPLTWVAGNRKPLDVIKYVVNHGVSAGKTGASGGDKEDGKSSGTTGYLFWETLEGYRFCTMDSLIEDEPYDVHDGYQTRVANRSDSTFQEEMKGILNYEFPKVGDYFEKLRSGAFMSNLISFNMDTGVLTNFKYEADDKVVTEKQKKYVKGTTRNLMRTFTNEKTNSGCEIAIADTGDQSRKFLAQTITRQNTFCDTQGRLTLPPQYQMRAGDHINIQIAKLKLSDQDESKYSKKHSGKYLISQVGHHIFRDGRSYTKLAVIRTTTQQNDYTTE